MPSAATARYDWILALCSIAFVFSAFGNGANDVANSYATSVAAQTLTMPVVGVLAFCTEFFGAVALGAPVTDTIKNGIIDIRRFDGSPGALMLAMSCAEAANAAWLMTATSRGMPVSTTQTIVGSLIGVGFATQADITWRWTSGSVSQIAASWAIAPGIAAGFAAIIFATLKYGILERKNSLKWAFHLLPVYIAGTCLILAAFLAVESTDGFEDFSAGELAGLILGIFFGVLALTYMFFIPFLNRKLIKEDPRIRIWHLPLGPLLLRDNPPLYFPGKGDEFVKNYYADAYGNVTAGNNDHKNAVAAGALTEASSGETQPYDRIHGSDRDSPLNDEEKTLSEAERIAAAKREAKHYIPPYERFVGPVQHHSWFSLAKWWGWFKFITLRGITMDVITHDSDLLRAIHAKANRYDVRVEHMWTYCQVLSAIMMSIAHGSNDVANAVGPWVATYHTYQQGVVATESPTPVWFLVIAGALLGIGFWFYGYHIVRSLGNKITQMSPTRGFAIELGAATTVLLASELGLPVSTTQCLTGAVLGVALMNLDLGAVNWRQLAWIFGGWVLTLPCSALIAGLLCLIALNTPHF
ncbi:hypothetical protein LTR78_010282 [Recurvomyces mirabilis]|uniref:Phosphate transporter n=1 Tax=Recurvomyces mirabilis TaxID=574656 RepID=A0AAE0TMJ1_9PEZI|nr:hypothetical protein LTR78_010282 [Recurvomyces mirabilis]KAK5149648.1 hypothetical protein LTS14_010779 [Recurvomyces mirabilis]